MSNMKVKAVIVIAATLILGFAIGFLTSSMITHQRMKKFRSYNSIESFKQRTIHILQPTEEQLKEILPLIDEYAKKLDQTRKDFGKEFFTLITDFHKDLKPLLTAEQIERLQSLMRPPPRNSRHKGDRGERSREPEVRHPDRK